MKTYSLLIVLVYRLLLVVLTEGDLHPPLPQGINSSVPILYVSPTTSRVSPKTSEWGDFTSTLIASVKPTNLVLYPNQETISPSAVLDDVIITSLTTVTDNLLLPLPMTSSSHPFLETSKEILSPTSTATVTSFTNTHALSSVTSRNQTIMFDFIVPLHSSSLRPASMTSPLLPYPSTISTSELDDSVTSSYLEQVQDVSMLYTTSIPTFITQPTTTMPVVEPSQLQDASMLFPLYTPTLPAFMPQPTTTIPVLEPRFVDESLLSSLFLGTITQKVMISETSKSSPTNVQFSVEDSRDVIIPSPTAVLVDLDPTQMHTNEEILPSLSPSLLVPIETLLITHLFSSLSLVRHSQSQVSSTHLTEDLLLPLSMLVAPAFASELTESQQTQSSIGYSSLKFSTQSFRTTQETYLPVPTTTHPFVSPSKVVELTRNPLNVQLTMELPASLTYFNPCQETILPSAVSNDAIVPSLTTMTDNLLLRIPVTSSSYPFLYISQTTTATVRAFTNTHSLSSVTSHNQTVMFDSIFPLPSSSLRPASMTSPLLPYPSTISTSEMDDSVTNSYLEQVQDVSMLFPFYASTSQAFMPQLTTTIPIFEQSFVNESLLPSVFLDTSTQKLMISDSIKSSPTKVQFSVEDSRDVIIPSPTAMLVNLDPIQMRTNEEILPSLSPPLLVPIETVPLTHPFSYLSLVQHSQLSQVSSTKSTGDLLLPPSMQVAPVFTSEVTQTMPQQPQLSMGYSSLQFSTHSFQTDQETYLLVPTTIHPLVSPSKVVELTSNPLNVPLTMELEVSSTYFNPIQHTTFPLDAVIITSSTIMTDNLLLPIPVTSSSYPFLYILETSKVIYIISDKYFYSDIFHKYTCLEFSDIT